MQPNYRSSDTMHTPSLDMEDYDNEPPLLEELGIHWEHIFEKTKAVINPSQRLNEHILDDADLAGPIFFW